MISRGGYPNIVCMVIFKGHKFLGDFNLLSEILILIHLACQQLLYRHIQQLKALLSFIEAVGGN